MSSKRSLECRLAQCFNWDSISVYWPRVSNVFKLVVNYPLMLLLVPFRARFVVNLTYCSVVNPTHGRRIHHQQATIRPIGHL